MIFIPLPFVVTLFTLALLTRVFRDYRSGPSEAILFILLLLSYALQSVFLGLRWGYDLRGVLPYQSTLAAVIAVLSWLAFKSLTVERLLRKPRVILPHLIPIALLLAEQFFWLDAIGATLIVIFLGYGFGLLWLARSGPDVLLSARLDGAFRSYRSLQITALMLIASALTDVMITLDRAFAGGTHAATVVAIANALGLLLLAKAASVASGGQPDDRLEPEVSDEGIDGTENTTEDVTIAQVVEAAMRDHKYYTDVDLNLTRLSRKLGLPARRVSVAINRVHQKSVSQYVNELRILEACRLLERTDLAITQIVFECGFQTKSNFNREFLRLTNTSPRQYRTDRRSILKPAVA